MQTSPLRIALLYALFAGLWILLSDQALALFISEPVRLSQLQTYKGWAFVVATASLLYVALRREVEKLMQSNAALRESEERFARMFRVNPAAISLTTLAEGRFVDVNESFTRVMGYTRAEVVGRTAGDLATWADPAERAHVIQRLREQGPVYNHEVKFRARSGEIRETLASMELVDVGHERCVLGLVIDITERKQAEARLRYQAYLLENVNDAVLATDAQFRITAWNRAAELLYGWPAAEALGRHVDEVIRSNLSDDQRADARRRLATTGRSRFEAMQYHRDGRALYVEGTTIVLRDPNGVTGYVSVNRDITEREMAEAARRESEARFRAIFEHAAIGIALVDLEGHLLTCNPAVQRLLGYSAPELGRLTFADMTHPDDVSADLLLFGELVEGKRVGYQMEKRYVCKDGRQIWGALTASLVRDSLGRPQFVIAMFEDITHRKEAEALSRQNAARAQVIADISKALTESSLDHTRLLETIVRLTARLVGEAGVVALTSEDGQWIKPAAFYHSDPNAAPAQRDALAAPFQMGEGPVGRVAHTGEALRLDATPGERSDEAISLWERIGIHSLLIVPLRAQGRVMGALTVWRERPGHPYTADDQTFLQDIADRAALAIQNALLYNSIIQQHTQLRGLSARLAEVEEAERRQLARELHDRVGQNLTALNINLSLVQAQLSPESAARVGARLADSLTLVDETVQRVRDVMAELRPPGLDDYGLLAALRWHAEQVTQRTGLVVEVAGPDLHPRLPPEREMMLYRAAQEALHNVVKHARATRATVRLAERSAQVRLTITDDGVGFEAQAAQRASGAHWGLSAIREQAQVFGGRVQIDSAPGQGAQVTVEIQRA